MSKTHRLKEPKIEEVTKSINDIVVAAVKHAMIDHRGDMTIAELALISQMYLTKAVEQLSDKKESKKLVSDILREIALHEKVTH